MIASIRAEVKKLVTVRSTYVILVLSALFLGIVSLLSARDAVMHEGTEGYMRSAVLGASMFMSIISSIVGVLVMAHEYRYNTIFYTLLGVRRRWHVLVAKIIVIALFVSVFVLFGNAIMVAFSYIGGWTRGITLPSQDSWLPVVFTRSLPYCLLYGLVGMLIITLSRNQVFSISLLFIVKIIEGLVSLLIRGYTGLLPFSSLDAYIQEGTSGLTYAGRPLSANQSLLIFLGYFAVAWIVAWVLFTRRDAN